MPRPPVLDTIAGIREHLARGEGRVALVPTMGALHDGHLAHVLRARELADRVVVSIFVNPLQFGAGEDLDRYPRDLDGDLDALASIGGVDAVFAPTAREMYPHGEPGTRIRAGEVGDLFEGVARPGHFDGMLTVVAKLLLIVAPDVATFGRKDAQQLFLVERMVRDLDLPTAIEPIEIVREPDGLARSSRNRYLDPEHRAAAVSLSRAIAAAQDAAAKDAAPQHPAPRHPAPQHPAPHLAALAAARAVLEAEPLVAVDYLGVVDPATFQPAGDDHRGAARILIAAQVGPARLIDTALIDPAAPDLNRASA